MNFLLELLPWVNVSKKPQITREQHIEDVLVDVEKDLANFQLTVQKGQNNTRVCKAFKIDQTRISKTISGKQIIKGKNKLDWKRKKL